ncbi:tail fiber assembly protein [Achromobacter xylosoxidans]
MALFWKNGGWYENIEGGYEVSPEYKDELMAGQVVDFYIATAEDGRPYLEKRPAPTHEQLAQSIRADRDELLRKSDWTQMPDVSRTVREAYVVYRQALRDITQQPGFPSAVAFPEMPDAN